MDILDLDIANADFIVPGAIVAICLAFMALAWFLSRPKPTAADLQVIQDAPPEPAKVDAAELQRWHTSHGPSVQRWIEHHESVLKHVSDQGLQLDLMTTDLTAGHDQMAVTMRDAITSHPAPPMRAQLSALVVSGEATLHALKRSEYRDAERQHVTYLSYRDSWLQRLRQFSSTDSDIRHLQTIPEETPSSEQFWLSAANPEDSASA